MSNNYTRLTAAETYNGKPETTTAYAAFCVYRDMDTEERSIETVSQRLSKSVQLIKRWSSQYHWVARAAAYDDVRRENERQQAEAERLKARKERKEIIRGAKSTLAMAVGKVNRTLKADGDVTVNELVALFKAVLAEERAEYDDLPTQRQEHSGPGGGPIEQELTLMDWRKKQQEVRQNINDTLRDFEE